jgi:outer membrane protein TolC
VPVKRFWIICFGLLFGYPIMGQKVVLSEGEFIRQIITYHPRWIEGRMQLQYGEAEVLAARGLFDPVLAGGVERKRFSDRLYYNKTGVYIEQPIPALGLRLAGGVDINSGINLNPEKSTGINGQAFAGLTLPLLQGMMIDERRTERQLSYLFRDRQEFEWQIVQNDILLTCLDAYWRWVAAIERIKIYEEVLENNLEVFRGIKAAFLQGDLAAIDTVETFLQYNRILMQYNREQILLNEAENNLMNHLWTDPLRQSLRQGNLSSETFPDYPLLLSRLPQIAQFGEDWYNRHPLIQALNNENERLGTLERWQREQLKPELNLHYNFLSNLAMSPLEQAWLTDNYVAGISFYMPLLFRTARGKREQLQIRQKQNILNIQDELNVIQNQVTAAQYARENIEVQVRLFKTIVDDSRVMYNAERRKFELGESSVFLVNAREIQYLQAMISFIDLKREEIMRWYNVLYEGGVLFEAFP